MKTPFVRLAACAIIFCVSAPLHASIITYQFSGTYLFSAGSFPGGNPSAFSGTVAYDTSTPATSGGWPDERYYTHAAPLGQSGLSIATNTGYVFATNPNANVPTYDVHMTISEGPNPYNDRFRAAGAASNVPPGWTNAGVEFSLHDVNNSLFNSTDLPLSLPTFNNAAELPANLGVSVLVEVWNPNVNIARFQGKVTRLQHVSTSSEAAVTNTGAPVTTNLSGGAGNLGGVTVGFTPSTTGTFEKTYNTVALDELPTTAPFTTGNFLLDVPGDTLQYWDLHYTGDIESPATVTFHFDPSLVTQGSPVGIWHYVSGSGWEFLGGTISGDTITVTTSSFSPFALAAVPVPEPSSLTMLAIAGVVLGYRWRKGRRFSASGTASAEPGNRR